MWERSQGRCARLDYWSRDVHVSAMRRPTSKDSRYVGGVVRAVGAICNGQSDIQPLREVLRTTLTAAGRWEVGGDDRYVVPDANAGSATKRV